MSVTMGQSGIEQAKLKDRDNRIHNEICPCPIFTAGPFSLHGCLIRYFQLMPCAAGLLRRFALYNIVRINIMLYDNPAARLKAILEHGMALSRDKQCRTAWQEILGAMPNNSGDLFAKLGKAIELPRRTLLLLQTYFPHQVPMADLWQAPIEAAFFNQNLSGQWKTFIEHINPYCIPQLSLIADLLHSKVSAQVILDEDINKLLDDFKSLIDAVDESTISEQLKNYLTQELGELVQAMRDYKVSGAIPILKQTESMVGHSLLDPEYSTFLTNHELGKRLLDNLNAMAAILTVAVSLPQLTNSFFSMLPK